MRSVFTFELILFSDAIKLIFIIPVSCKPKAITITPPIIETTLLYFSIKGLIALTEIANNKKTALIPKTKNTVVIKTLAVLYFVFPSSSISFPPDERYDMYSGTSGSTHGDRKDNNPSTKILTNNIN